MLLETWYLLKKHRISGTIIVLALTQCVEEGSMLAFRGKPYTIANV